MKLFESKQNKRLVESEYDEIAKETGTRPQAVKVFLNDRLGISDKEAKYVVSLLKRRVVSPIDFATAMLGKPDNKYEKVIIGSLHK